MTHEIHDLHALKLAVAELGGQWAEGKQTAQLSRLGNCACAHVIKVPGVPCEIGVTRLPNGHYALAYDPSNCALMQRFGADCQKLFETYAVHQATLAAAKAEGLASPVKIQTVSGRKLA